MNRARLVSQLEIFSSTPVGGAKENPILFVHGAFTGGWIWAEYFLPYFASRGYSAYALSLRGHGGSEGYERLPWISLGDFVEDLEQVIGALGKTPILVGHSMGGMVVQKYLERASKSVPAVVLMASVPPDGLLSCSLWLALNDPLLFYEISLIQFGGPRFATPRAARRAIFSADMPEERVRRYFYNMQAESQRVMFDMSWLVLPQHRLLRRGPVLILGAGCDALIPAAAIESTARAFGTQAKLFPSMAHAMMLEANWCDVAEHILRWLFQQNL